MIQSGINTQIYLNQIKIFFEIMNTINNKIVFFFSSFIFVFFYLILLPKLVLSSDFCISFKNGKTLLVDDYWEVGDKLYFEINDKEYAIDKNKVFKVIDSEKYSYSESNKKNVEDPLPKYELSKYESNGGVIILNNGKKLHIQKSWIQENKIFCLSNNFLIDFSPDEIKKFSKTKNFIETDQKDFRNLKNRPQTKKERLFDEDPTTTLIREKIQETEKVYFDLKKELVELNSQYESWNLRQKRYFRNKYTDEHRKLLFRIRGCRNHIYELHNKLDIWRQKYYDNYISEIKKQKWNDRFKDSIQ